MIFVNCSKIEVEESLKIDADALEHEGVITIYKISFIYVVHLLICIINH